MSGPLRADVRRLSEALRSDGIDPRHWSSHATVGTTGDDGTFDPGDGKAIHIAPDGVWLDVLLEPRLIPLTVRLALGAGVHAHIQAPVRPGDRVLVLIPDGNYANAPTAVAILNSEGQKIPLGSDGKPVFQNDRLLIQCGGGMPVQVLGAKIVQGDFDANENMVLGQQFKSEATAFANAVIADVRPSPVGPIAPSADLVSKAQLYIQNLDNQLSDFIFGQKSPPSSGT